jgi:hypothetical protein
MAQRVLRHHGLAGARARPGAARRIDAVGGADGGAGHMLPSTGSGAVTSRRISMQRSNISGRVFDRMRHQPSPTERSRSLRCEYLLFAYACRPVQWK